MDHDTNNLFLPDFLHGWYSPAQAARCGHIVYATPGGGRAMVTLVGDVWHPRAGRRLYLKTDLVFVGRVTHFIESHIDKYISCIVVRRKAETASSAEACNGPFAALDAAADLFGAGNEHAPFMAFLVRFYHLVERLLHAKQRGATKFVPDDADDAVFLDALFGGTPDGQRVDDVARLLYVLRKYEKFWFGLLTLETSERGLIASLPSPPTPRSVRRHVMHRLHGASPTSVPGNILNAWSDPTSSTTLKHEVREVLRLVRIAVLAARGRAPFLAAPLHALTRFVGRPPTTFGPIARRHVEHTNYQYIAGITHGCNAEGRRFAFIVSTSGSAMALATVVESHRFIQMNTHDCGLEGSPIQIITKVAPRLFLRMLDAIATGRLWTLGLHAIPLADVIRDKERPSCYGDMCYAARYDLVDLAVVDAIDADEPLNRALARRDSLTHRAALAAARALGKHTPFSDLCTLPVELARLVVAHAARDMCTLGGEAPFDMHRLVPIARFFGVDPCDPVYADDPATRMCADVYFAAAESHQRDPIF